MRLRPALLPALVLWAMSSLALAAPPAPRLAAQAPSITLLEVPEAQKAIVDDSAEPYFERLQRAEIQAKTGLVSKAELSALRTEARGRYVAAVRAFTPGEREAVTWVVNALHARVQRDYPLIARTPWSFLKISDELEGGFPHTRGPHIVLPQRMLDAAVGLHQAGRMEDLLARVGGVVLHEQAHVVQRAHPALFAKLFTKVWGFQKVDALPFGPWLEARHVLNPDGTDTRWIYPVTEGGKKRWVWPLLLLTRTEEPIMGRDFQLAAVALKKTAKGFEVETGPDGEPLRENLMSLASLVERFPDRGNLYHPNEISASVLSNLVLLEAQEPKEEKLQALRADLLKRWAPFRAWARANLR
ncbi:hypothetical protein P2318_03550 [Myxococcaceae bacterium GXIMD 01537]